MAAGNVPLQQRAGRNIGIESLPVFIQAAGAPEVPVPVNNSNVTLLEGVKNGLRTPFTRGVAPGVTAVNNSGSSVDVTVYYKDDMGNLLIVGSSTVPSGSTAIVQFNADTFNNNVPLTLCEGESLVASAVVTPG